MSDSANIVGAYSSQLKTPSKQGSAKESGVVHYAAGVTVGVICGFGALFALRSYSKAGATETYLLSALAGGIGFFVAKEVLK